MDELEAALTAQMSKLIVRFAQIREVLHDPASCFLISPDQLARLTAQIEQLEKLLECPTQTSQR